MKKIVFLFLTSIVLSGCVSDFPATAQGFRQLWLQHPNDKRYPQLHTASSMPFDKVVHIVKSKAHECLDVTINVAAHSDSGGAYQYDEVYTPTMKVNGKKAELFVLYTMRADRYAQIVADFYPASGNGTKIVIYHLSYDPSLRIAHAISAWAHGNTAGCPDMER